MVFSEFSPLIFAYFGIISLIFAYVTLKTIKKNGGKKMNLSFSVETIVKVVKRFLPLIIVFAIGFYSLGYYLTKRSTSVSYYSYTELYIHTVATGVEDYTQYIAAEGSYVDTYLLTINTYKFYEELRQQLPEKWRDSVTAGYLKSCVSPSKKGESAIIRFSVYTYSAELTYEITRTLSTYMDDYLFYNYRVNSVQVVEEPRPSTPSIYQNRYLALILAVVGIATAFIIGYVKELSDRRIKSVADVETFGIPILGVVPNFSSKPSRKSSSYAYSGYASYSHAAESAANGGTRENRRGKKRDRQKSKNNTNKK